MSTQPRNLTATILHKSGTTTTIVGITAEQAAWMIGIDEQELEWAIEEEGKAEGIGHHDSEVTITPMGEAK